MVFWDSTWLRRRYRGGGFEDWDRALHDLSARGYNAIRIDAYPHLIAREPGGEESETFKDIPDHHPNFYGFGMRGSPWTSYINPRKALPEFLRLCRRHGVKVILTTWFKPTECRRNEQIEGADGLGRKFQIPVGCTEGWGMVLWTEHPLLDWAIHRETAEIAA